MATLLNLNLLSNLSLAWINVVIITSKIDDTLNKYIFYGENDFIARITTRQMDFIEAKTIYILFIGIL